MVALQAAAAKAREIGTPQCIAVVDRGGHLLAFLRMDGAKVLSLYSATQKAATAASSAAPSGELPEPLATGLAAATQGRFTNLRGGLPILVEGRVIGAIGVGSGTAEQDLIVARAGIDALLAALDGRAPG
jgi:glc operon protein GlcG